METRPDQRRVEELFQAQQFAIFQRTDRLFSGLMIFQWLAGIAAALWLSPLTWSGASSRVHIHVWAASLLGGLMIAWPVALAWMRPGRVLTRHVIAVVQMLTSTLLIQLTGGRIETHFHVFGSLAFLAFYRDWRVLITASAVVAIDHFVRGIWWPQSVYGISGVDPLRWLEHAGWVLFEDVFLAYSCVQGVREMRRMAQRHAELEAQTAQLETSERRFRSLAESAPVGVYRADPQLGRSYTNPQLQRITGRSAKDNLGDGWIGAIHPEDRPRILEALAAESSSRETARREFRMVRPDGATRWVLDRSAPLLSDTGERLGVVGTVEDITELKAAERRQAAIAGLSQRALGMPFPALLEHACAVVTGTLDVDYSGVLELMPDGENFLLRAGAGWRADTVGVTKVPAGRESQAGCALLTGQSVVSADHRTETRFQRSKHLDEHGAVSGATVVIRGSHQPFGVLCAHATTLRDFTADEVLFLKTVANLVTEAAQRHRSEEALRKSEEQLRQAQKMEAVGRLAGGVAHDFNNLLTIITGYSELLSDRLDGQDALRADVEEIRKAGAQAASLTRQLLAFSRRQVLQPRVLDLNTIASDMEKMLKRLIGEDIALNTVRASGLGEVKADPGQMEQVIMNLAVNARDAMPRGGTLTIETANVTIEEGVTVGGAPVPPGPYVMLAVSDTGTGMTADVKKHLFEPFFTTKEKGKGTGLGLATVYGIVKQSGGHIVAYSELGEGTTFKVYLPRIRETRLRAKELSESARPAPGHETILLVEDDDDVRRLAACVLRQNGYTILEAHRPSEATELCQRHDGGIDLLLTDVIMPETNGRELAGHLTALRPDLKVLFMSGYTENVFGVLEPGTAYLEKPFSPGALARKVREALKEKK